MLAALDVVCVSWSAGINQFDGKEFFFVNKLYPYLTLAKKDKRLQPLIADVMNQQRTLLLRELYAYAFKRNTSDVSRWKVNETEMKSGV